MKIVVIGGGAAGASCATRLRRLDEFAQITIIEKTSEVSIANCGLPYYVSEVIDERDKILVSTPMKFKSWFNIDVKLNSEVININKEEKFVTLKSGEKIEYDKLVLTLGASPIIPNFEGMDWNKIFAVRTLYDADRIKNYIKEHNPKKAIVIGGGFIGVEMAENVQELGLDTTLIELQDQVIAPVDWEVASFAQNEMRKHGIHLILSDGVKKFDNNKIILNSGKEVDFDFVVMAIGVKPEIKIAQETGLKTNKGIIVDDNLKTSDENIYAAGDSIEVKDFITGNNTIIPLAGPANRQGRIIADNICGRDSTYKNSLGAAVLKVFNLTVANVGNNEKQLQMKDIPYLKTFVFGRSHAGYYPNSTQTLFKLLFSKEGKIYGAQAVGEYGVEKRIDVISSIIRDNGYIQDMIDVELCYAPPYSSAKDPVNILGMKAENILTGLVKPAYIEDFEGALLVDVRPPAVFAQSTIKNSINIPITQMRERYNELPHDKRIILYCNTGYTSYNAARILMQRGFDNVYSFNGGEELYKELMINKKAIEE